MDKTKNTNNYEELNKSPKIGIRHVQFIFLFFCGFLMYSTRFSFSVAIVAMTEKYSSNPDVPYYNWTNKSFILSTFFWGYILTQIPVGILSTKFGVKKFVLAAVFINSACMFSIPTVAAYLGSRGVMVCRIIQGLAQGVAVPSLHGLIGKWAIPIERCRVYGFMATGYYLGAATGLGTTGFISASWIGWPLNFYLFPSLGFIWSILYYFYGASSPATHKTITEAERIYIQTNLDFQDIYNVPIPYRAIFTSVPVWALLIMQLCSGWGFCIFTTEMPIYMDKVMNLNIKLNGVVTALPSLFTLIIINFVTFTSDYLVDKKYLSIGNTRKLMSALGSIGCAILLLIFVYLPTNHQTLAIVILIAAYVFRSFNSGGFYMNHLDLGPNFGGALMGIVNTTAEIFSFITPIFIQYVVYDETDRNLWKIVFITAICLYVVSTCFYVIFASGEVQPWNHSLNLEDNIKTIKSDVEKNLLSEHV